MRRVPVAILVRLLVLALLVAFLLRPELFQGVLQPLNDNDKPAIYNQGSLFALTLQHLELVLAATVCSTVVAILLAVLVTRAAGREFLALSRSLVNIGQTFPPVAVLALAVPAIGFGWQPAFIALFLYGLLPIFENTMTGLTTLPPAVMEAARGMGLTDRQRLFQVELPLALPIVLAGIRLSAVIGLATATIGSTVAARTLGEVIIAGLISDNLAFIVQGGLIVAVLAVLLSDALTALERVLAQRVGRIAGDES